MTSPTDFDQQLKTWLDDGAAVAPERFVWAAIAETDRTPQRGAWRVTLEGLIMRLQPAAPILGIAAIAIAAIALYAALIAPNVGSPTPTPRMFTAGELSEIVLTEANVPDGMTVDATTTGSDALNTPMRSGGETMPSIGFEDALMTNLNSTDAGGYVSWAAVYETPTQADLAFDFLVAEHESEDGWGLEPMIAALQLGDESRTYSGPAYAFGAARIHLWRVNNLLLAAVFVDVESVSDADATRVGSIAQRMDDRAQ